MSFGTRLKTLRAIAKLTQEDVARAADMSLSSVRDYENDRKQPLFSNAEKLADALGVDVTAFRTDESTAADKPKKAGKKRK